MTYVCFETFSEVANVSQTRCPPPRLMSGVDPKLPLVGPESGRLGGQSGQFTLEPKCPYCHPKCIPGRQRQFTGVAGNTTPARKYQNSGRNRQEHLLARGGMARLNWSIFALRKTGAASKICLRVKLRNKIQHRRMDRQIDLSFPEVLEETGAL